MPHHMHENLIQALNDCAAECGHCASACLQEQDVASMVRCISLDLDCAAFCRTAAELLSRGSELAARFCELCAEACDMCAAECERHSMDHCKACAEACRRCATECRGMGQAGAGGQKRGSAEAQAH